MNKDIKVEDNNQSPPMFVLPTTEADSEPQPKITMSSPACSNNFVACCAMSDCLICLSK